MTLITTHHFMWQLKATVSAVQNVYLNAQIFKWVEKMSATEHQFMLQLSSAMMSESTKMFHNIWYSLSLIHVFTLPTKLVCTSWS